MQAKIRIMYAKSNMLRQNFHYCSDDVKRQLFIAFFSNLYNYVCTLCEIEEIDVSTICSSLYNNPSCME